MLTFTHGVMESGKTLHMISSVLSLRNRGKGAVYVGRVYPGDTSQTEEKCVVTRFGDVRLPLSTALGECIGCITPQTDLLHLVANYRCAAYFIDEAQFLTPTQVRQLRQAASTGAPMWGRPDMGPADIHTYGLRADYTTALFPGSGALFALADKFIELDQLCHYCDAPACVNSREINRGGGVVVLDKAIYRPTCYHHRSRPDAEE